MSLPLAPAADSAWLHYVLVPAGRALLLAGAVWLFFIAFRIREVSLRLTAWTIVLYAALAMPLLSRVVPEIRLPILTSQMAHSAAGHFALSSVADRAPVTRFAIYHPAQQNRAEARQPVSAGLVATMGKVSAAAKPYWPAIALALYLLVLTIFLARLVLGLASGRRLRLASSPLLDEPLRRLLACEVRKAGLKRPPQIAESAALSVPATLGIFRHVILLPVEWNQWTEAETSAVLAHELSHIARRDGLTQALSRLHQAFFWFSPLAWWLDHALVELAEQASDDAALRAGADRVGYAEVLLHFFRALKAAHGRVRWEGVSMAQGSRSQRRVERILRNAPLSRGLGLAALGAVLLVAVPLICLTAGIQPSRIRSIPTPPQVLLPPPPMALTLASLPATVTPALTRPAVRPVRVVEAPIEKRRNGLVCNGESFAVVSSGSIMGECASPADLVHVWNLRRDVFASFVWFRWDAHSYIIDDPITVKAALLAFAPLRTIERQQEVLVWKEDSLARDRAALAMREMMAGIEAAYFESQFRSLEAPLRETGSAATPRESARAQAEWAQAERAAMRNSVAQMEWLEAKDLQAAGQRLGALVARQDALGREQAALDAQQIETARQAIELAHALIGQSLLHGLAQSL